MDKSTWLKCKSHLITSPIHNPLSRRRLGGIMSNLYGIFNKIHRHSLSFPPDHHLTRSHFPSSNAECAVLPRMGLSGIVMVVDEIWPEHRGNEKSACYGAIMVYSTLDVCPMGLLSSRPYTLFHLSVHPPLGLLAPSSCLQWKPPSNSVLDWWKEKTETQG